jgi:Tfp pilus assembly protein PilX
MQVKKKTRTWKDERGVSLLIALLTLLIISLLVAGIIFVTRTDTATSANYTELAQARYAAEAGVQSTINWLTNNYTAPTTFASYNTSTVPVNCVSGCANNGGAIVLSAINGITSNYPDSTVANAYNSALSNQALPGLPNASYATYATLVSMNPGSGASWLGGGGAGQTWQITSQGTIAGMRTATVQVVATLERTSKPIFNYAVETTSTGCKSIYFAGTDFTDSYNSNLGAYGGTNIQASGGDFASNGNVTLASGANIKGTIYDDSLTTGACPAGITSSGTYQGTGLLTTQLNPPLQWGCTTTPCYPSPLPPTTSQSVSTSCGSISGCTSKGSTVIYDNGSKTTVNQFNLAPGTYGNLTIANADVVYMSAGTYNVNSLIFSKDGQIVVSSGPVVLNVAGQGFSSSSNVVNAGGLSGWNLCSNGLPGNVDQYGQANCPTGPPVGGNPTSGGPISGIPGNFQIVYAGAANIASTGAPVCSVIYAPNADVPITGAAVGYYGAIISSTFAEESKAPVHYDSALKNSVSQVGPFQLIGFSWSKF